MERVDKDLMTFEQLDEIEGVIEPLHVDEVSCGLDIEAERISSLGARRRALKNNLRKLDAKAIELRNYRRQQSRLILALPPYTDALTRRKLNVAVMWLHRYKGRRQQIISELKATEQERNALNDVRWSRT